MEKPPELQAILNASDSELIIISAAVAERGVAFCRVLGKTESVAWADEALRLTWMAVAGEPVEDECADVLDNLDLGYNDDEDDTSQPEFFIDQSLSLVGNAISVLLKPDVAKVELSVNTMRTLLSMLDFTLTGEQVVIVGYGEETPPPGPLQQMEINAEREVVDLLVSLNKEGTQRANISSIIPRVKASSREFSTRLAASIEEVADLSNWEL
ncbi:hypothetical protein [Saccharomonospora xinjiangensis]|uniref:hypothetical protein n=1 Tax=Saccharomonospora xinjiangensis TaxID=75294 RepID=UPI00106FD396|nr:hypothetical protein [Saccharomonospora xinjiangensis]